jgi:hypothetical protein
MVRIYTKKRLDLVLKLRKRNDYATRQSNKEKLKSKKKIQNVLSDVNKYLLTFGLQFKNKCLTKANDKEFHLDIDLDEKKGHEDLTYLQVKDKNGLSDQQYNGLHKSLEFTSLYKINKLKKKINQIFEPIMNNHKQGFYVSPKAKIKWAVERFLKKNPDFEKNELKIKISMDGCQIANPRKNILNVTFTMLDDVKTAMSVEGNYILGRKFF